EHLDSVCREKARILNCVPLNRRQRFRSVRHARRVAEIDEPFIRQMLMQRAIDGKPTNATVEDADWKRSIHPQITQITQIGTKTRRPQKGTRCTNQSR